MMQKPEGYDKAQLAAEAYQTPRFHRLRDIESWVNGTQYANRPDWWTGGSDEVPLWERAPCYVFKSVKNAIASNVDLVLGEGRFPSVTSRPDEDEEDDGSEGDNSTDENESDALDRLIREHHKLSRFKAHTREAFATAQGCGTAVAIHGHRNGKPFADLVPARWCTPKFDADKNVTELEIKYTFFEEYRDPTDRKWKVKAKLFRRVIDESKDTTFKPADANEEGTEPNWVADPELTVTHGLGFCPVVWYAFMRGCKPVNQIDGTAIHEGLNAEIEALDVALSLKHRVALYSEPQIVETGVDPDHNPSGEMGRAALPSTERGGYPPGHALYTGEDPGVRTGAYLTQGGPKRNARKKGVTFVWRYSDPETKVSAIGMPPEVMKNLDEHCNDLLAKLEECMAVVLPRPQNFKFSGAISGKSLVETKQRQFDRCDQYRDDLADHFIVPSVNMQLRIAQKARENLRVPGIQDALPVLDRLANVESA